MDEGAVVGHDVLDVSCSVYVSRCILCRHNVVFLVAGVEDEPVFPGVFVVAVFFIRLVFSRKLDGGVSRGPSLCP